MFISYILVLNVFEIVYNMSCVYFVQLEIVQCALGKWWLCIIYLYWCYHFLFIILLFSLLLASKFLVHYPITQEEASSEGTTPMSEMYPSLPPSESTG